MWSLDCQNHLFWNKKISMRRIRCMYQNLKLCYTTLLVWKRRDKQRIRIGIQKIEREGGEPNISQLNQLFLDTEIICHVYQTWIILPLPEKKHHLINKLSDYLCNQFILLWRILPRSSTKKIFNKINGISNKLGQPRGSCLILWYHRQGYT